MPSDVKAPSLQATSVENSRADGSDSWINLAKYQNVEFNLGRGRGMATLWYFCSLLFFEGGWFPFSSLKVRLLRFFGATVGSSVVIKPHVRIKFPWRLRIGNHSWIGQNVWIDNLADVDVGNDVCISQFAYLCTGSHDHRRLGFDLVTKPIAIGDGAWIGARSTIFQGVIVGANSLVAGGSVVVKNVQPTEIVAGNPAAPISRREAPNS